MTVAVNSSPSLASRLVNGVLAIKPLANLAKQRARQMMIKRAAAIGVDWLGEVEKLRARDWDADLASVQNPDLVYPTYYVRSFHAYEEGNLGWEPATEVEVAAYAVHARIWQDAGAQGDALLRQSYHEILKATLPTPPANILDIGCSVGMSTFALQAMYPQANITGVDLSPYFLAVASYKAQARSGDGAEVSPQAGIAPTWLHAAAESTGLADASFDLVSAFLIFHELPQSAAIAILKEARRLLRPGGYFALMDMNPQSDIYASMPPYILTLLKSTEPYLDEYFTLDLRQAIVDAGFESPTVTCNSPRHRTVIAKVK
ncbi:MAG: class I SAM-dependent methyltransferase [Scytolyngbya sp. HA4215-MV1]|jgi:ubiquinone/menaquinone biosynthesis C-methylase UbiE|nr:class I SAM-dependent methyltransferase [Scytolyngbya sp. HA4215-MV1]